MILSYESRMTETKKKIVYLLSDAQYFVEDVVR